MITYDKIERWESTGLLQGIACENIKCRMSKLLDNQFSYNEEDFYNASPKFKRRSIPLIRRIFHFEDINCEVLEEKTDDFVELSEFPAVGDVYNPKILEFEAEETARIAQEIYEKLKNKHIQIYCLVEKDNKICFIGRILENDDSK